MKNVVDKRSHDIGCSSTVTDKVGGLRFIYRGQFGKIRTTLAIEILLMVKVTFSLSVLTIQPQARRNLKNQYPCTPPTFYMI
jgi:hypothetical protein